MVLDLVHMYQPNDIHIPDGFEYLYKLRQNPKQDPQKMYYTDDIATIPDRLRMRLEDKLNPHEDAVKQTTASPTRSVFFGGKKTFQQQRQRTDHKIPEEIFFDKAFSIYYTTEIALVVCYDMTVPRKQIKIVTVQGNTCILRRGSHLLAIGVRSTSNARKEGENRSKCVAGKPQKIQMEMAAVTRNAPVWRTFLPTRLGPFFPIFTSMIVCLGWSCRATFTYIQRNMGAGSYICLGYGMHGRHKVVASLH